MAKRLELLVEGGELNGKRFAVGPDGLRLGRSSSNDINIKDEKLSRNHCLFEQSGETGIMVTDLASANGTILNGEEIASNPVELKAGDVLEVGDTVINVVGEAGVQSTVVASAQPKQVQGKVDLGFGGETSQKQVSSVAASAEDKKESGRRHFAIVVLTFVALAAVVLVFSDKIMNLIVKQDNDITSSPIEAGEENPVIKELYYEKVEANSSKIYRYEMRLNRENVLSIKIDDVPGENRHVFKHKSLDERAMKELNAILDFEQMRKFDREYAGMESAPTELESSTLKVIYSNRARSVRIVNAEEPEAFRVVREKLETFSKNELGAWAIQYSREKLIELAQESIALGRAKWEDRDVKYGNLSASLAAYNDAFFYLDTLNPKPDFADEAKEGMLRTKAELEKRYKDQRFLADRAINLGNWEDAKRELLVLIEMFPDRTDDRNREASNKLIDIEKRMQKKGGR